MARPIPANKAQSERIPVKCSTNLREEIENLVIEQQNEGISAMARDFLKKEVKAWSEREPRTKEEAKIVKRERLDKEVPEEYRELDSSLQMWCSPDLKTQVKEMMAKRDGEILSDLLRNYFQTEVEKWQKQHNKSKRAA